MLAKNVKTPRLSRNRCYVDGLREQARSRGQALEPGLQRGRQPIHEHPHPQRQMALAGVEQRHVQRRRRQSGKIATNSPLASLSRIPKAGTWRTPETPTHADLCYLLG